MPPKKQPAEVEDMDSTLKSILAQLSSIQKRQDKVDLLGEQLTNIEESMKSIAAENTIIRQQLTSTQTTLHTVQNTQNNIEQYNRSWSVRIMGLQLSQDEEENPFALVKSVYNRVFLPILTGAMNSNTIPYIPSCEQLLERAHVLPTSKPGEIKPIICRFYNRDFRAVCFRLKKEFAPRLPAQDGVSAGGSKSHKQPRYAFPFYEDLTATTFKKLKELQADPRVEACWSVNGQLRFRLTGSDQVKKVKHILDPIESILK
jgi:hypothetical protein